MKNLLEKDLLESRKSKNLQIVNLLKTLKGSIENELSKSNDSYDVVFLNTVKSFRKSLKLTNTSESLEEFNYLEKYLPKQLTEEEVIESLKDLDPSLNFGAKMGIAIKKLGSSSDGKTISKIIKNHYS